eukprot:3151076-Alexandrium_andersonii.AAC.1
MSASLVGSEMCIRDRCHSVSVNVGRRQEAFLAGPARTASAPWAPVVLRTGPQGRSAPAALVLRGPSGPVG